MWGAAQAVLEALDFELDSFMRDEVERRLSQARNQVGETVF